MHDVVLATGALSLTPAPVPPAGSTPPPAPILPPTGSVTIHAVVANKGNVAERGIALSAALRTSGAATSVHRSRRFAVAARSSVAVTLPHLRVVPGRAYTLTVRVDPPTPDVAGASTTDTVSFDVAPPTPPAIVQIAPTHGRAAGGTDVTIFGSGFAWVRAVDFGRAAARFTVVSSTQITAVAPPGSGAVRVEVVNAGGPSASVPADRFAYRHR